VRQKLQYVYGLLIIVALLVGGFALLNRPQFIRVGADIPVDFPTDSFSHRDFESLLKKYVDQDGNVDYTRWHSSQESVSALNAYLAAVSRYSPDATPERFSSESQELAYWLYGYNAYVIKSVLDNWPLKSVTDVKAPLEVVKGMGFFYRLRFEFGGQPYSLLNVENSIIRKKFRDARIHFVLNCASESCPPMRPTLPTGDALDALLTAAAADFVNDPGNVSVDHDNRQVILSTIFKWFRKDFLNDLAKRGLPSERGLIDYVSSEASETLRVELDAASGYEVVFRDYDWSLNGSIAP
jgi:hypothetical protein